MARKNKDTIGAKLVAMRPGDVRVIGRTEAERIAWLVQAKVLRDAGVLRCRIKTFRRPDGLFEAVALQE